MARRPRTPKGSTPVGATVHRDKRTNLPTADAQDFVTPEVAEVRTARYHRHPELDPQLVWKGKDEQDERDLEVDAPPIYIQEKIDPRVLIENLRRTAAAKEDEPELRLFDTFDGLPELDLVDFYKHDANWSNRMILGDGLNVMSSLAERKVLRGKVQMIYVDPPYGVKFQSNWQAATVAYPGAEKDYTAIERTTLRGRPIAPLGPPEAIVDNGLVEQALHFVARNTRVQTVLVNGARVDRRAYPTDVVREVVVNALVHRDYLLTGTDIELSIYSGRLEVVSPGRLPNAVTVDRMLTGCRTSRNQLLVDTMRDYGYVEGTGMGIPRKVVRGMRAHNGTDPQFVAQDETLTVRLLA